MSRDSTSTWVKLHRKIADNPVMRHPVALQVLVWCLVKVQRLPYRHSTRWGAIDLLPGEVMTARRELADKLGTSERKIRTALELLSKERIISVKTTNTHSIIKLTNWASHQDRPDETTSTRPALDQHSTQEQESKKERMKEKNNTLSADAEAKRKAKELQDYFFAEYERIFKRKLTWSMATGIQQKTIALISAQGMQEAKRLADNYLASTFITSPTWRGFLADPDRFHIPMLKSITGPKSDYENKRGRGPSLEKIIPKTMGDHFKVNF